ncbi:MAG: cytochrome P450 [Myxococcota bacterium]
MLFRALRWLVRLGWPMRALSPWFGPFHPFLPSFRTDPYPHYQVLREQHPAYVHRVFRSLILSRHTDISRILKDPTFSVDRSRMFEFPPFGAMRADFKKAVLSSLLMTDPPDHTRIRNLVNKAFTPRRVDALRPRIQAIVDELLESLGERGEPDFVRDFAVPMPITVIAELLGVPAADRERFKNWSTVLGALLDPLASLHGLAELEASFVDMVGYFEELFEQRRREPRDDLMSALVTVEEEGDKLNASELLSVCALILGAGHETTTNLLGNAVVALLRNPGERKRLMDDPGLIGSAVDEFLRYDGPVQVTDRIATQPLEVCGHRLDRGSPVILVLGAGNRDPRVFENPDQLDLGRTENRHLSFGQGMHFCLGAQLARAEAQIAVNSLLARYPDFSGNPDPPSWRPSFVLRGPSAVPLRL